MMSWIKSLLGRREPSGADSAFGHAMKMSGELIHDMREASTSNDVFRAMMADIWMQRQNVPFMVTVFEAVQEMKSGTDQQGGPDGNHSNP